MQFHSLCAVIGSASVQYNAIPIVCALSMAVCPSNILYPSLHLIHSEAQHRHCIHSLYNQIQFQYPFKYTLWTPIQLSLQKEFRFEKSLRRRNDHIDLCIDWATLLRL